MNGALRIALADDHALFREGLKGLLRPRHDVTVVAETDRVDDVEPMLARTPCDLLLLDLRLDRSSVDTLATVSPRIRVIVLTMSERIEDAVAVMRAGARGLVFKRCALETLLEAVLAVAAGRIWVPPQLESILLEQLRLPAPEPLTAREREVVCQVAAGLRNAEVGLRLGISEETVKKHLNAAYQKLGVRDRVQLTLRAIDLGMTVPR